MPRAAQRMQAAGLDGIEFECYGHLMDRFWSPATNQRDDEYGGSLDNRLRFTWMVIDAVRAAVGPDFIVGMPAGRRRGLGQGPVADEGLEIARRLAATGKVDFLNIIRGHIDTDAALTKVIPMPGMRSAPHLDFAGEVQGGDQVPGLPRRAHQGCRDRAPCDRRGQARHGRHDARPHRRSAYRPRRWRRAASTRSVPASAPPTASTASMRAARRCASTMRRPAAKPTMPQSSRSTTESRAERSWWSAPAPAGLEAARVAAERGHAVDRARGGRRKPAARSGSRTRNRAPQGADRHRRLAPAEQCERLGVAMRFQQLRRGRDSAGARAGRGRSSPPAAAAHELLDARRRARRYRAGTSSPATSSRPRSAAVTTTMAPIPAWRPAEFIVESGAALELVTPGAVLRARDGRLRTSCPIMQKLHDCAMCGSPR